MNHKILTICTLKDELVKKYDQHLVYLPLSNEETDRDWLELIQRYQPRSIVFGLQAIDDMKLSTWRSNQPHDDLKFVRKGTSLHRVDFGAAKKYNIEVTNTPGINAPFVADFILTLLAQHKTADSTIAILGVGDIGKKVVNKLLEKSKALFLFNRTHHQFESSRYYYENNLADIFSKTTQIAICLPLTNDTQGIITAQHIKALPQQAQVICISPPRVFSADAIIALQQRTDVHITFDHVASGLSFIHESLGHNNLRANFIFDEQAAAGYECQYAMGEAAILKALD